MKRAILLPLALLAMAACSSDSTGPDGGSQSASLSFTTRDPSAASVSGDQLAADVTITSGSDVLVLTRVQIVLGEIELKTTDAIDCDNSGPGSDPNCAEIELDPVLVDLPLSGGVRTDLSVNIPPGTYREIEFEMEAADDDTGPEAVFLAANPAFRRTSVRVEGTFNGVPFVFTSAVEAEQEFHLQPPLVVGGGTTNVTVFVDVGSWFRASGGGIIDPHAANLTAGARASIESNIRASFEAFGDDDRDGRRG